MSANTTEQLERAVMAYQQECKDLRARLQTAEQQLADTQKEFGRIQGTSAKQVVDRFLDLMRKLNEKDLPAGFESWEAFLKHIDGISRRAVLAEQQIGQVREEVKGLRGAAQAVIEEARIHPTRIQPYLVGMLSKALSATPSDGRGKGRTDTELLDWLEAQNFSLERQWNLETKEPGGVRLDVTSSEDHWKEPTVREAIDKAMEAS